MADDLFDKGMAVRKAVLGAEYVARAEANKTEFDADWQRYVTEHAWAAVWTRPGLEKRTRTRRPHPRHAQHRSKPRGSERGVVTSRSVCRRAGGQFGVRHCQARVQRDGKRKQVSSRKERKTRGIRKTHYEDT